jgi:hypothetical protein
MLSRRYDIVLAAEYEEAILLDFVHCRILQQQAVVRERIRDDRGVERIVGVEPGSGLVNDSRHGRS